MQIKPPFFTVVFLVENLNVVFIYPFFSHSATHATPALTSKFYSSHHKEHWDLAEWISPPYSQYLAFSETCFLSSISISIHSMLKKANQKGNVKKFSRSGQGPFSCSMDLLGITKCLSLDGNGPSILRCEKSMLHKCGNFNSLCSQHLIKWLVYSKNSIYLKLADIF